MVDDLQDEPAGNLSKSERDQIVRVLVHWAKEAPSPDEPVLLLLNGTEITPAAVLASIDKPGSRIRRHLLNLFAVGMKTGENLEEMLADMTWGQSKMQSGARPHPRS